MGMKRKFLRYQSIIPPFCYGQKLVHAGRVYVGGCNKAESIFIKPKLEFVGMNVPIFAGAKKIAI